MPILSYKFSNLTENPTPVGGTPTRVPKNSFCLLISQEPITLRKNPSSQRPNSAKLTSGEFAPCTCLASARQDAGHPDHFEKAVIASPLVVQVMATTRGKEIEVMFDHILVPLDGSPLAENVLPHAVALGQAFGARITLVQVLERTHAPGEPQFVDPLGWHIRKAEAGSYLDRLVTRLQQAGLQTQKAILEGRAAERIMEFARSQGVSLTILCSHGRSGLSGWNISSVVQKIVLRACVPTMIVRAYSSASSDLTGLRYRRVLIPLDGSQRAECVLPLATNLARYHKSLLLLAHVVCRPEMPRRAPLTKAEIELADRLTEGNRVEALRCLEQLRSGLRSDAQIHLLVSDSAAAALHQLVEEENVDLVVLSAHGYAGGSKWPYGSMALNFIAYGTTPLLIIQDLSQDELECTQAETAARECKGH